MKTKEQREKDSIRSQKYRDTDREEYNKKAREYRAENADKINTRRRQVRKENSSRFKEYDRNRYAKDPLSYKLKGYNISKDEYLVMVEAQGNKCAICECDMVNVNIDHCHTTKKVRGLLCTACNTGIGKLKDSISTLKNAIKYLTEYEEK